MLYMKRMARNELYSYCDTISLSVKAMRDMMMHRDAFRTLVLSFSRVSIA